MDARLVVAGACICALAAAGSYFDLRYRRLPNWLCGVALVGGIGLGLATGGWTDVATSLLHALIALAIAIGLFALGGIGAGDAKYYAALAAWFPLRDAPLLIAAVSLAGLALVLAWAAARLPAARRRRAAEDGDFAKLPYGVAIAAGAVAAFFVARL